LVKGNVLQGLPFAGGSFDFVHQRFMLASAVPVKSWSGLLRDLVRVVRPGGWIELVEGLGVVDSAGPATQQLMELFQRLQRSLGLDTTGVIVHSMDQYLRWAGMTLVARRDVHLPVGEWGGDVGSLMASDFRAAFTRLSTVAELKLGVAPNDYANLVATATTELEEYRSTWTLVIAFGHKPA
jgi:hypothetical protein